MKFFKLYFKIIFISGFLFCLKDELGKPQYKKDINKLETSIKKVSNKSLGKLKTFCK